MSEKIKSPSESVLEVWIEQRDLLAVARVSAVPIETNGTFLIRPHRVHGTPQPKAEAGLCWCGHEHLVKQWREQLGCTKNDSTGQAIGMLIQRAETAERDLAAVDEFLRRRKLGFVTVPRQVAALADQLDTALAGEAKARTERDAYQGRVRAALEKHCITDFGMHPWALKLLDSLAPSTPAEQESEGENETGGIDKADWCCEYHGKGGDPDLGCHTVEPQPYQQSEALRRAREYTGNAAVTMGHDAPIAVAVSLILDWAEDTDRRRAAARKQLGKCFVEGRDETQLVLAVNELIGDA